MDFIVPSQMPPIATYRVLDFNAKLIDRNRPAPDVIDEQALTWHRNMLIDHGWYHVRSTKTRSFELLHGMCKLDSTGEEGITVGSAAAFGPDDIITTQYRETGVIAQRGYTLEDFLCQLMHNKDDPGKGRNMPVHYSGRVKTGVHAVASTLGIQTPHAVGAAYAMKLEDQRTATKRPRVAAAYFGEGAASEGDFHEALNFAAVREYPVVFICRNNGFAISTPNREQYRGDGIASRGVGYGIEAMRVDGTDIFAVYEATVEARRRTLADNKPILLELMSYRSGHHSTSDDSFAYRSRQDASNWSTQHSAISLLRKWLEKKRLWTAEQDKDTRTHIRKDIIAGMKVAEKKPMPPLTSSWDDVYAVYSEEQTA
ncbi:hypothetical protein LTR56_027261 [Elasticomyces elasticus]|nr:hypothetical protein LTR56_027261 [Elasticomyces elasticus]